MYKIRQQAQQSLEMSEQGVIIAPKTGVDFANFSNQRGVRQSSLFLGKHRRSSINQEDQNAVLIILGENTCYFFPLG